MDRFHLVDPKDYIAFVAGGVLLLVGGGLMRSHVLAWRRAKNDTTLNDHDRRHHYRRYRRRMQTSGMLLLLGVLVPLGDNLHRLMPQKIAGWVFGPFWIGVLLLIFWVMLLAVGDMVSTGAYARGELARVRHEQRKLEEQLMEMKRRSSNGQHREEE